MKTQNKNILTVLARQKKKYSITIFEENGKEYISVPAVIMVEGVHHGSQGKVLHTAEYLSVNVEDWDDIPVTITHPMKGGNYVGVAECPEYITGHTTHTVWEDGLKTELVLDVNELSKISPKTLKSLQANEPIEVSIGAFSENIEEKGTFKGEDYDAKTVSYIPDHVAILPDDIGACSYVDGCGIRVYQKGEKNMNKEKLTEAREIVRDNRFTLETYKDKPIGLARNYVNGLETDEYYFWLLDVTENSLVYEKSNKNGENKTKTYMREFTIDGDQLVVSDEEIEVVGEFVYKKVGEKEEEEEATDTGKEEEDEATEKEEDKEKEKKPQTNRCCEQKVVELIANKQLSLSREDKDWLSQLTEEQLQAITPRSLNVDKESVKSHISMYKSMEDIVSLLPDVHAKAVQEGLDLLKEERTNLIKEIQANTHNAWGDEELNAMETSFLKKLHKTSKPNVFVGGGAGKQATSNDVPALPPLE